jgi:hypothetical protein
MITVQKDAADPQKVQELQALVTKFDDAGLHKNVGSIERLLAGICA